MASSSFPPLIEFITANMHLLSPYITDIRTKTWSKITTEYDGATYFIAKKLLEDAYLSGDSFSDVSSIELFLDRVTFNAIYKCYANKTMQKFLDEISHLASEYGKTVIIEDIKAKVRHFNFLSLALSVIQPICEEYFNGSANHLPEETDKEHFLYWVWLIFAFLKQTLFSKTTEVALAMELLSHIFQEIAKNINASDNSSIQGIGFDSDYFFGLIQEKLSKTSMILLKRTNCLSLDIATRIHNEIKAYFPKGQFIYCNEEEVIAILQRLEAEIMAKMSKDDISFIHIYKSFPIETFDKQIEMITSTMQSRQNQRLNSSFNNTSAICLNSIKLKLEVFIEDLKAYTYLDISFIYSRYSKLLFLQPPFAFRELYKEFFNDYIQLAFSKLNLKFNYIFIKSLFINLMDMALNSKVIESGLIFTKSFHYNFLIVAFYIYFNLQFIDNQSIIISLTLSLIQTISQYSHFIFIEAYSIVLSLFKLENVPFNLRTVIRKMQQDMLSFCLFSKHSFVFRYLGQGQSEDNEELTSHKVLRAIIDDFYQYSFEIIYKTGNKLGLSPEQKEEVFKYFQLITSSVDNIETYLKEKYVDIIIIAVMTCYLSKSEEELKSDFNKVKLRYIEEKKKSLLPEVFKEFLAEGNDFIEETLKSIYKLKGSEAKKDALIMLTQYDCKAFLFKASQHYNTIYSYSFSPFSQQKADNYNTTFLSHKRIRALTPTIQDKTLHTSPFIQKTWNYNSDRPAGAFKNLTPQFYFDFK